MSRKAKPAREESLLKPARAAVFFDEGSARKHWMYGLNVFGAYMKEIVADYGIPFDEVTDAGQIDAERYDIVIAAHTGDDPATAEQLWRYAENGGTVISYSGLRRLAGRLGCSEAGGESSGYAALSAEYEDPRPLRYLRAVPWKVKAENPFLIRKSGVIRQDRDQGEPAGDALLSFAVGQGSIERFSVDIPAAIVGFQQGLKPVVEDGIPAEDGSGKLDEGILKADDECAMDWELDRMKTHKGTPYYAHPYADLWKNVLIEHLIRCCYTKGLSLPFLGFWPDRTPKIATVSHDSDSNLDETAFTTLEALHECGIQSTWCMLEPGYSEPVYAKVKEAGHELAFHYNAREQEGYRWDGDEFARQAGVMKQAVSVEAFTTNKNHYTRFEGWGDLFQWCEENGIEVDQSRGPSKRGNVGFLFGTCRPYAPIASFQENNRLYAVLEVGFLTPDLELGEWSDLSIVEPLLEQVDKVEGVAHFLFHQYHIHHSPAVRQALSRVAELSRARGYTFWTSRQINEWVKARRSVRLQLSTEGREVAAVSGKSPVRDLVVWVPAEDAKGTEIRFGIPCRKQVVSIGEDELR